MDRPSLLLLLRLCSAVILLLLPALAWAAGAELVLGQAHPAIWRVKSGVATAYLFGSLHILPEGYAWRTPEIDAAMAAADRFVFEVPVDEESLKDQRDFIIENGILPRRQTLRGLLSASEFDIYTGVVRRAGLKPEQVQRFRPWLASVLVGLAYLHQDNVTRLTGADDDIKAVAQARAKDVLYLESIREQMELLTIGDAKSQLLALKHLLVSLPQSRPAERQLLDAWAAGDSARLARLIDAYFDGREDIRDILIDRRNRNWLAAFKEFLAQPARTTMITVGAAHIGGKNGLIALLCSQGFKVERLRQDQAGASACQGES